MKPKPKMKINKACDLSSISVLPPHARNSNMLPNGMQGSQLRSQPSQQSFSHGLLSQHAMLSQFSQSSLDERLSSQERESSVKKASCLPLPTYAREESQLQPARSSGNLMLKWNSSSIFDQRSDVVADQRKEGFQHQLGLMETSLNKFGMILDSLQNDMVHANKGLKEVALEMESMRQKTIAQDDSLQTMIKGQVEIKACLEERLKYLSDQKNDIIRQERLQELFSMVSAFPKMVEFSLHKAQKELLNGFTREMQVTTCYQKRTSHKNTGPSIISPEGSGSRAALERKNKRAASNAIKPPNRSIQASTAVPQLLEAGGWKSVKNGLATFKNRVPIEKPKQKKAASPEELTVGRRPPEVTVESDEDINGGFSYLLEDDAGYLIEEIKENTQRILMKARRRKRKHYDSIIID